MNTLTREVLEFIDENDVKFIRLAFCDIFGVQKNLSIMANELEKAFEQGIAFDSSSVAGFENEDISELFLFPDPTTLSVLPWRPSSGRVVRFICDIKDEEGNEFAGSPRAILKNAVKAAEDMGYKIEIGTESEFYIFKLNEEGKLTKKPYDYGGYFDISPLDKCENIRREICFALEDMGIMPTNSHHEHGPGQNEIDFKPSALLSSADNFITFKWVVKSIANQNGGYATFIPKPLLNSSGSGLHINISILKNGKNILDGGLDKSKESRYFVAGIMNRIKCMTSFLNSTENSYERFGEFEAPKYITWAGANKGQLIRVISGEKRNAKIKVRSLDAMTNPYISFALIIFAGLEGIENKEELPKEVDKNLYFNDACEEYNALPGSLKDALKMTQDSEFIKKYLSEDVISNYIEYKTDELENEDSSNKHF